MGEHAISASYTVRTSTGVHYLNYNRWGDSTQRFVPYTGNQTRGKKMTMELYRYLRESASTRASGRFGPISRNPSPTGNRRARSLREDRKQHVQRRRFYSPEAEPISDEETKRNVSAPPPYAYRRGRKYPSRAFRPDSQARKAASCTQAKRNRTPSPEAWPYKRDQGSPPRKEHPRTHYQQALTQTLPHWTREKMSPVH